MPTSRAYGALPNVPRIFRTGTALCRAPRWRIAPARPAVIQTEDEQSRDATNTKFTATRFARSTHPASKTTEFRASSGARRHQVSTQHRGRFAFAMKVNL
jgi:hypothetical protein